MAQAIATEPLDLERMVGLWPAVVERVRRSGAEVLSRALEAARPIAVDTDGAVLKLGFPPSAAFNKRKAEAQDARDRFAEALTATVGERLRPVYVLLDSEPDPTASAFSGQATWVCGGGPFPAAAGAAGSRDERTQLRPDCLATYMASSASFSRSAH